jgi:hypothetical protein
VAIARVTDQLLPEFNHEALRWYDTVSSCEFIETRSMRCEPKYERSGNEESVVLNTRAVEDYAITIKVSRSWKKRAAPLFM